MENFDWSKFTRKIAILSDMKSIYNAWTVATELEKWFLSNANFYDDEDNIIRKTESISEENYYAWQWFLFDVTEKGKILSANGQDHLQFTFAGDCIVDVNLSEQAGHTICEITQSEIPDDEKSKKHIRLGCDSGWSFFLVNLKSVYESGIDLRNKNEALKGMVNS